MTSVPDPFVLSRPRPQGKTESKDFVFLAQRPTLHQLAATIGAPA